MPLRESISSALGIVFALLFPFLNWDPVLARIPAPSILIKCATASALAALAFGINQRPLKLFGLRRVDARDFWPALLA